MSIYYLTKINFKEITSSFIWSFTIDKTVLIRINIFLTLQVFNFVSSYDRRNDITIPVCWTVTRISNISDRQKREYQRHGRKERKLFDVIVCWNVTGTVWFGKNSLSQFFTKKEKMTAIWHVMHAWQVTFRININASFINSSGLFVWNEAVFIVGHILASHWCKMKK